MSNLDSLTDKLSSLTIDSNHATTSSKIPSKYQKSATTSRLLAEIASKSAAVKSSDQQQGNAGPSTSSSTATIRPEPTKQDSMKSAPSQDRGAPEKLTDIGTYDGGFESDTRGEEVTGEAAEELALDSSTSR